ncbi:uncharacterized protein LOC122365066 [Amphibalanus amphitrite]|uniref:uncharacterized protein LOC122365066 n=1 Tax=Amphibalanus amphitrite TaxID=1232801 RepID=UPI001C9126D8|nr:uncharacterized protein LOC122365066 [Amphibalanus amphitrite]
MAFMVPVLQNDWNLYGPGSAKGSRRGSQQPQTRSAPQSRRPSHASGLSRQTSASSSASASTAPGFSLQYSDSRGAPGTSGRKASHPGQRSVTFGPPSPPSSQKGAARPAEKHNFHTKVVDKLMRVVHRGEKDGARRS